MEEYNKPLRFFLLRGLAREIRHWGCFPQTLKRLHPQAEVVPLEIPGAGQLRKLQSPTNTSDYIRHLRSQYEQYQKHHGKRGISVIIGLSFGGMLAGQWTTLYPDDFQAAIIMNSSSRSSNFYQRLLISGAFSLLKSLVTKKNKKRELLIAACVCNTANIDKVAAAWSKIRETAPISSANALRQLYSAARFRFPAASKLPTLILCSSNDRLVSYKCSVELASEQNLPIIFHPTAGHDLTTDDPDWCAATIFNWLIKLFPELDQASGFPPHQ